MGNIWFSNLLLLVDVTAVGVITADLLIPKCWIKRSYTWLYRRLGLGDDDQNVMMWKWIFVSLGISLCVWVITSAYIFIDEDNRISWNFVESWSWLTFGAVLALSFNALLTAGVLSLRHQLRPRTPFVYGMGLGPIVSFLIATGLLVGWLPDAEGSRFPIAVGAVFNTLVFGIVLGVIPILVRLLRSGFYEVAKAGALFLFLSTFTKAFLNWNGG